MSTAPPGRFYYEELHNLGAGGFGIVDAVRVTASNSVHAVGKHLARKKLNDLFKEQPEARERFEREITVVGKLKHPSIVTLEGVNVSGQQRCYFMPLFPQSLRALLLTDAGKRGFTWQQVARFGASIANALAYAHSMGVVHRDLKPENILLDEKSLPYITDWGVGRFVHKHSTVLQPALTKAGIGTEYYCSLEQWTTGAGEAASDVYSLGIMIAECVLGAPPAMAFAGAGVKFDIVPPLTLGAILFNNAIKTMTAMLAKDRVQTMLEVERTLYSCADLEAKTGTG
jgi:serine/threonine-protein kinase